MESDNILSRVERELRRYIAVPEAAYVPIALWCLATYFADCFDVFPYIAITSPVEGCGKSRLLELLRIFCERPWMNVAATPAALFRKLMTIRTLLADELQFPHSRPLSEMESNIIAILNVGYRKGATVPRCVGGDHHVVDFPVYGPKAFASIGSLPRTLRDRSIIVRMQRKTRKLSLERFFFSIVESQQRPLLLDIASWTHHHMQDVTNSYHVIPDLEFLTNERDAEIWQPLFAVCNVIAPGLLKELKNAATILCNSKQADKQDDANDLHLLADIRQVWNGALNMPSADLVTQLCQLPEAPWGEREFSLTVRKLAKCLRPFGVSSQTIRTGPLTIKGYRRSDLEEAWERYLPPASSS